MMNLPKLTYPIDLNEESILILQPPVLFGIMVDYSFEFPQGHISSTLGFLLDGGLLKYRIIYTPQFPYCLSPLKHQYGFPPKLLRRQGGGCVCNDAYACVGALTCVYVCTLTYHNLIYAYQAEPGATS